MANDRTVRITHYERLADSLKSIDVSGPANTITTHTAQYAAVGNTTFGFVRTVSPVWTSSNPAVGSINPSTGLFTASGAAGTTQITASVGSVTSTPLTVTVAAQVKTTVVVTPNPTSISDSGSVQLTAVVNDQDSISPNPIAGASVGFSSGTPSKATVSGTGLVSGAGAGAGSTIITVTSSPAAPATVTVTVTASAPVVTTVGVLPNPASVQVGNTQALAAQSRDQYTNPIADTHTWGSANAGIATVNGSGVVQGVSIGTVVITATSVTNPAKSATTTVGVGGTPSIPQPSTTDYVSYNSAPLWATAAALSDDTQAAALARSFFSGPPAPTFVKDFNGIGTPAMRVDLPTWVYSAVNQPGGIVANASPQTVQLTSTTNCNNTSQLPNFEPGLPAAVSPNRESFKRGSPAPSIASGGCVVDKTNNTVTAIFSKNHADGSPVGIDFDTTSLNGSGFTLSTPYAEPKLTAQMTIHFGRSAGDSSLPVPLGVVPSSPTDRLSAEWFNTICQSNTPTANDGPTGVKVLLSLRDDTLIPMTLTQDVVGSPTSQFVTVNSTAGFTLGKQQGQTGETYGAGSQFIRWPSGSSEGSGVVLANILEVKDATTIRAVFKGNHSSGTVLDSRRDDGRWYCVFRGPQSGVLQFQCDVSPYFPAGQSWAVNMGPLGVNPDTLIGTDLVVTMQLEAASAPGVADGVARIYVNDVLAFSGTNFNMGPAGWAIVEGPATFRSSALDQSYYVFNYRGWSPNSICTAPTGTNRNANATTIFNNVAIPDAPSGVPDTIRPYVLNGGQYLPNNGGGSSDPSFGDITLSTYQRGKTVLVAHPGLTTGTPYSIKYVLANALGISPQSNATTTTPALPPFTVGFNCRSTLVYRNGVGTIPPDDTNPTIFLNELAGTYPVTKSTKGTLATPVVVTTPATLVLGWNGTNGATSVNRSTTVDARLAGNVSNTNAGTPRTLRIDLPVPGVYALSAAFGDPSSTMNNLRAEFIDGVSGASLLTVSAPGTTAGGTWLDATGTPRITSATWVASNATTNLTVTGNNPYLLIKLGTLTAMTSPSRLAFIGLNLVG